MTENAPPGIMLQRFAPDHADLVLAWRNAPRVREMSLDGAEITPEAHRRFLLGLRERSDVHYWMVVLNSQPAAALNLAVDGDEGRWGCYIGAAQAPHTGLFPLLVVLAGRLAFEGLDLAALRSEVMARNHPPQRLNAHLGLIPDGGYPLETGPHAGEQVLTYRLARADWPALHDRACALLTRQMRGWLTGFNTDQALPPCPTWADALARNPAAG